jgi:hypothetical protein
VSASSGSLPATSPPGKTGEVINKSASSCHLARGGNAARARVDSVTCVMLSLKRGAMWRVRLLRHGLVYAAASERGTGREQAVHLRSRRRLATGRYTLEVRDLTDRTAPVRSAIVVTS